MKIFIDIGHPAHVHYFKNFIQIMKNNGYGFLVTARDKEVTHNLLDSFKIIENIMEDSTNIPKDIDIVIATGKANDLRRDFRAKKAFFSRMDVKVAFLHLHSNDNNTNEKLLEEIKGFYDSPGTILSYIKFFI